MQVTHCLQEILHFGLAWSGSGSASTVLPANLSVGHRSLPATRPRITPAPSLIVKPASQPQFTPPRDQAQPRARCTHKMPSAYTNARSTGPGALHPTNRISDQRQHPNTIQGASGPGVETSFTRQTFRVLGPRG